MTKQPIKNIAASIYDQLRNKARETNSRFDEWLRFFSMERFLYRLSKSHYAEQFILKGALMFKVWKVDTPRPTLDIDLLGNPDLARDVTKIVRDICQQQVDPYDGLTFDPGSITANSIAKHAGFQGMRLKFHGELLNAHIPMQIDIGFGTVLPPPVNVAIPPILGFSSPRLRGYTKESMIAEKFHAMVNLGILNSRMKDFFDIWLLSCRFRFNGAALRDAIAHTFDNRGSIVSDNPVALTETFSCDPSKVLQWKAFRTKLKLEKYAPELLSEVINHIRSFIMPVARALNSNTSFNSIWKPHGPWKAEIKE